jgi:hypothetical protein
LSLYQQVMGADYRALPAPLQHFHALEGRHVLTGMVDVSAPASFPARVLAWSLGAPMQARQGAIRFELHANALSETWIRHFPGGSMQSRMTLAGGRVTERLGPARLGFTLVGGPEKLQMQLASLHFLGVPCPRWLRPAIVAEETASEGRLHFLVQASLPFVGVVTRYQGHLDLPGVTAP